MVVKREKKVGAKYGRRAKRKVIKLESLKQLNLNAAGLSAVGIVVANLNDALAASK